MSGLLFERIHTLVTVDAQNRVLHGVDLRMDGPRIVEIGTGLQPKADERRIDGSQLVVYPGFVNTHHHSNQTLQRCVPYVANAKLFDWLVGLYEIWRHLAPDAVYTGALVAYGELLLSGCTTVADHFYCFPKDQPGELLDETIRAARELGVRHHPTRGSMSCGHSKGGLPPDDVVQDEETIMRDCERVVRTYHDPSRFSMLRMGLAPCSPFSVTKETMRDIAVMARQTPGVRLHTHLAETRDEDEFVMRVHGMRPLELMESLGWIGSDVWYAHGVYFQDHELDLLARTQTGVAHCPSSNLRLGSGIARIPEMLDRNVPVGLAVDGSASNDCCNMLMEMRQALLVHRVGTGVDRMKPADVVRMATMGGARVLGRDDIGSIEPGKAADVTAFRLDDLGMAGALHDPAAAPFMSWGTGRAEYTVVNGKVIVDQGRLTTIDVEKLAHDANLIASRMIRQASSRTGIDYLKLN